jgi:hypothetical protein
MTKENATTLVVGRRRETQGQIGGELPGSLSGCRFAVDIGARASLITSSSILQSRLLIYRNVHCCLDSPRILVSQILGRFETKRSTFREIRPLL